MGICIQLDSSIFPPAHPPVYGMGNTVKSGPPQVKLRNAAVYSALQPVNTHKLAFPAPPTEARKEGRKDDTNTKDH